MFASETTNAVLVVAVVVVVVVVGVLFCYHIFKVLKLFRFSVDRN